jgi:cytochrome c oxidase subunit 3
MELHMTHLEPDLVDTIILTALLFSHHGNMPGDGDAAKNAMYSNFVVLAWLPIYAIIYLGTRFA